MTDYPYSYTGSATITGERPLVAPHSNIEVRSEDDWGGVLIFEGHMPDLPSHPTVRFGQSDDVIVLGMGQREVAESGGPTVHFEFAGLGPVPFGPPQKIAPRSLDIPVKTGTPTLTSGPLRAGGEAALDAPGSGSARIEAATATSDAAGVTGNQPPATGNLTSRVIRRNDPVSEQSLALELILPELDQDAPDPDGVLSDTSAAIARNTPDALIPQVRDVRRRMRRLGDTDERAEVRLAANSADIALSAVELHMSGEISDALARPHARSLAVLMADILPLGGPLVLTPPVYALFYAAYLIALHRGYLKR